MKKIFCYLFHKITFKGYAFTDWISGEPVNDYRCEKCNRNFMATSKWSTFRCDRHDPSDEPITINI